MPSARRWRGSWRVRGRRASPSTRFTTPGRQPAPISITTAACASCPRRPARTSHHPSRCPSSSWPLARGFNPRERSWNFSHPWPGGRWTLRDIVSYQTDGAYALLQNAARYRDRWLANFLTVGTRAVRGWRGWPYAYVIPRQHQDSIGLVTLLGILHRGQVEIRTALHPIALGGQRFPAGRFVVVLRQPYAAFAKTLLEPQRYPDLRLYPGGPPLPPYDVTAHTDRKSVV